MSSPARAGWLAASERHADLVWALLTVASVLPFWAGELLALTDWPHHLVSAHVVAHFDDPARNLAASHRVDLWPRPYLGPTYVLLALLKVTSLSVAGKILLSGYAVALSAGARALVRAGGRDPRLAWFGPLFVHQWALAYGFIPYVLSIPPALFAVAAARRLVDAPRLRGWAALGGWYVVAAIMHPFGVALAATASAGLLLAARAGRRLWVGHGVIWAAVGLFGLLASARVPREGAVFQDLGITTGWRWTIKHRLVDFALAYLPGNLDYVFAAAGIGALTLALGLGLRAHRGALRDPLEAAALAVFGLYLVAPVNLAAFGLRISLLSPRLIAPMWLFALGAVRGRAPRLAAVGAIAALGHAALLADTHHTFSARWAPQVEAALEQIPPGAHIEPEVSKIQDSALNPATVRPPEEALHAYAMQVAGFDPKLFSTPQGPLQILEQAPRQVGLRCVQTSTSISIR